MDFSPHAPLLPLFEVNISPPPPLQVRTDPKAVLKLRCLFLKLRSMLELPLLRIGQAASPAAAAVRDFYSVSLLAYVRRVLQVPLTPTT